MALAMVLRGAVRSQTARSLLKLSTPSIRNVQGLSLFGKNGSAGYLAVSGANDILPKVQHLQVRNSHMDHGLLWTVERVMAVGLLGIIPLTVLVPSTIMDDIFAICVIIHNHWGLEAIVIDYVRPVLFGQTIPKISIILCYLFSAAVLGGLLYFNHHDIGIGNAINKLWNIRKESSTPTVEEQ